jgi:ribosomal protein S1
MSKKKENFAIELEKKELSFDIDEKTKLMPHVYEEYSEAQIKEMLELYGLYKGNYGLKIQKGDEINGKLVGETDADFLIDIGYKDYVRVEKTKAEINSLRRYANEEGSILSGTEVNVLLVAVNSDPYLIKGSIAALSKQEAYTDIINAPNQAYDAKILSWNPAGFDIEIQYDDFRIPAFMPNTLAGINKLTPEKSQSLVGSTVKVMIESYAEAKGTFITSRKKYLKTLIPKALDNIQIKDENDKPVLYKGEVTGSTDFGVFVEFNECLTGMIHKDNLDEESFKELKARNISQGQTIEFYVKEIVKGKLILVQVWRETLWDTIKKDDEFESTIKDFKNFGALVRLDEETVGLVHTSELEKGGTKYEIGDSIKVKVISVQRMERKIFLSLV